MLLSLWLLKIMSVVLWAVVALLIWNILARSLLMEKVFSLILAFLALSFWLFLNGLEFLPLVILLLYIGAISVLFLFVVMIINPDFIDLLNQKQQLILELQARQNILTSLMNSTNNQTLSMEEQNKLMLSLMQTKNNLPQNSILQQETGYYSFFFFSLLAGSFFGGLLSWWTFVSFKFYTGSSEITKILQVHSLDHVEQFLSSQLGLLSQVGNSFLSNIKIQAIYHPTFFNNLEIINIGLFLYTKYGVALIIIGLMLLVSMIGAIILTLRQTTFVKRQQIGSQLVRYSL